MTRRLIISAINMLALTTLGSMGQTTYPPSLSYLGIIRDFSLLHPDFEGPVSSSYQQTNLLAKNLTEFQSGLALPSFVPFRMRGSPNYPYLVMQGAQSSVARDNFGSFYFDEWYWDIPGINIPHNVNLTFDLVDANTGTYSYSSLGTGGFFALDGKGYGQFEKTDNTRNFWFTTEFRMNFYYRGGETFVFNGDDDLWVFIDGKLTSCDLGGIHPPLSCTVALDAMGLQRNHTYSMVVLHAERHTTGSNFELTTSILPVNNPPQVKNYTLFLNQDSAPAVFSLESAVFDADVADVSLVSISGCVEGCDSLGTLSLPGYNTWFPEKTSLQFTPNVDTWGTAIYSFNAFDGTDNSTTVAYLNIIVQHVNSLPVAFDGMASVMFLDNVTIRLNGTDKDNDPSELCYRIVSPPLGTILSFNPQTGELVYQATVASLTRDFFQYVLNDQQNCGDDTDLTSGILPVNDDGNKTVSRRLAKRSVGAVGRSGDSNIAVVVIDISARPVPPVPPPAPIPTSAPVAYSPRQGGLTSSQLGFTIAGSILGFIVLSTLLGILTYWKLSAAKFQSQWEEEFRHAQLNINPLYQKAFADHANPLYESSNIDTEAPMQIDSRY